MAENLTTYVNLLKEWYTDKRVENMTFRNNPLLAMWPKEPNVEGESWDVPIIVADPQAGSATFATGQANKGNTISRKFQVITRDDYSFAAITRKVIKASKSDKGAFLPAARVNVDGAFNTAKRSYGIQSYGNGGGTKGEIGANAGFTITLADINEVIRFHLGESVQLASTKTGGALIDAGAADTITAIDKANGILTFGTAVATTWSSIANGQFVLREGDYDVQLEGLEAWLPVVAPTGGDNHFGVDRSIDTEALAGVRFVGTSLVYESLIDAQSTVATIGDGIPDHVFLHPTQSRALAKEQAGKVEWTTFQVTAEIGFQGFVIQGDSGKMRVIPDRYCPATQAYLLQLDTWEMGSMGPTPDIFDRDTDQEMLREAASDGYEIRIGGYSNVACHAPGYNGNCTLPAQS